MTKEEYIAKCRSQRMHINELLSKISYMESEKVKWERFRKLRVIKIIIFIVKLKERLVK